MIHHVNVRINIEPIGPVRLLLDAWKPSCPAYPEWMEFGAGAGPESRFIAKRPILFAPFRLLDEIFTANAA